MLLKLIQYISVLHTERLQFSILTCQVVSEHLRICWVWSRFGLSCFCPAYIHTHTQSRDSHGKNQVKIRLKSVINKDVTLRMWTFSCLNNHIIRRLERKGDTTQTLSNGRVCVCLRVAMAETETNCDQRGLATVWRLIEAGPACERKGSGSRSSTLSLQALNLWDRWFWGLAE